MFFAFLGKLSGGGPWNGHKSLANVFTRSRLRLFLIRMNSRRSVPARTLKLNLSYCFRWYSITEMQCICVSLTYAKREGRLSLAAAATVKTEEVLWRGRVQKGNPCVDMHWIFSVMQPLLSLESAFGGESTHSYYHKLFPQGLFRTFRLNTYSRVIEAECGALFSCGITPPPGDAALVTASLCILSTVKGHRGILGKIQMLIRD